MYLRFERIEIRKHRKPNGQQAAVGEGSTKMDMHGNPNLYQV